jgi:hypothetical protein
MPPVRGIEVAWCAPAVRNAYRRRTKHESAFSPAAIGRLVVTLPAG